MKNKYFHPDLDFLFNDKKDLENDKPYFEDGNENMYTDEMIEKRKSFKNDPEVIKSIENVNI